MIQSASLGTGISKPVIRGFQGFRVLNLVNGVRLQNQQWGGDHGLAISQLGIDAVEVIKIHLHCFMVVMLSEG